MNVRIILLITVLLSAVSLVAQSNPGFAERFIFGTSGTYIPYINELDKGISYHEFHWDNKAMVNINKSIYTGIRWMSVFTRGNSIVYDKDRRESYYIVGAFAEYDLIPKLEHRAYVRVGWNYGNFCVCGDLVDSSKEDGLHYPALGYGAEYYFIKNMAVMVEVEYLYTLPRSLKPDNLVRYGVGIQFRLDVGR